MGNVLAGSVVGDSQAPGWRQRHHERLKRREASMHALVRSGADVAARVQRVEMGVQLAEQLVPAAPVAEELLRVEQRIERRPELQLRARERSGALRSDQEPSGASSSHQEPSEAIRSHPKPSEATRSHKKQPEGRAAEGRPAG